MGLRKEDIEALAARLLSKKEAAHFIAGCFRDGFQISYDEALAAVERQEQRRFEAAVALLPGLVEGYMEHATKNGWEYGWQEGVAQDAVILADALVAALYPEEVGDE